MNSGSLANPPVRRALGYPAGLALLWLVLAAARPTTTFHLAPFVVAASFAGIYLLQGGTSLQVGLWLVLTGGAVGLAATAFLSWAGYLAGPSLLPVGGAAFESLVGVAAGTVLGLALVAWRSTAPTGERHPRRSPTSYNR